MLGNTLEIVFRWNEMPVTMSVPQAGKLLFGYEKSKSYALAKIGEIPTRQLAGSGKQIVFRDDLRSKHDPNFPGVAAV